MISEFVVCFASPNGCHFYLIPPLFSITLEFGYSLESFKMNGRKTAKSRARSLARQSVGLLTHKYWRHPIVGGSKERKSRTRKSPRARHFNYF